MLKTTPVNERYTEEKCLRGKRKWRQILRETVTEMDRWWKKTGKGGERESYRMSKSIGTR